MKINEENYKLFEELKAKHLSDNGKAPDAYAITGIISKAIINKNYIHYKGGGPYKDNGDEKFLKKFDVVVTFNISNDPQFSVVIAHDNDFCDLVYSDENGDLLEFMY